MWYWFGWVVTIVIAILIGAKDWIKAFFVDLLADDEEDE
ncbi:hypothetical protein SMU89_03963 [Streptococcus mutans NLML1]|nr:hypothetical protein SMU89_03963 [Streptococcus mutans NLML1]